MHKVIIQSAIRCVSYHVWVEKKSLDQKDIVEMSEGTYFCIIDIFIITSDIKWLMLQYVLENVRVRNSYWKVHDGERFPASFWQTIRGGSRSKFHQEITD